MVRVLSVIIAVILAFLGTILIAAAIWNLSGQIAFLNPDTYKNGLAGQGIYNDVVPVALPALAGFTQSVPSSNISLEDIAQALKPDDWRAVADELIPPKWLQTQVEHSIDLFFEWVNGDAQATEQPSFNLSELQSRLTGEAGQRAVDRILTSAPTCTDAQISQWQQLQTGSVTKVPICRPPEEYLTVARTVLTEGLKQIASAITKPQLSLVDMFNLQRRSNAVLAVTLTASVYRQLVSLFYLCPAAILALIVIVVVRSLRGFGRWIGIVCILSGVLAIVPLPFLSVGIVTSIADMLAKSSAQDAEIQLFQARLLGSFLRSAFNEFSGPVLIQAGVFTAIGVFLLAISFVAKPAAPAPTYFSSEIVQASQPLPSTASPRRTKPVTPPNETG